MASKLNHYEYGNPLIVLRQEDYDIPVPENDEVLLEILAAPVNPVDINFIQGKHLKSPLPAIPGYEGVARVLEVGSGTRLLSRGDHVIPYHYAGTWRTHLILSEDMLLKIPKELGLAEAATLSVNPPTVYRMLTDYVKLFQGDTVIQNGANSACGQLAIQMCRIWGINTVNIIRNRPKVENLKSYLKNLGANFVFTEDEIKNIDLFKSGKLQRPKLALNCVGGVNATTMMNYLENGGTMVTYGGMSLQHIPVPTSSLVFNNVKLVGFNVNQWMLDDENVTERENMFRKLILMMMNGTLKTPPYVFVHFNNYKEALQHTLSTRGMTGKKYILKMSKTTSKL